MLSFIIYSTSTLLLAGISHASPAIPVQRQDIGTANFVFEDEHCKREQVDRDLVIAELEVASGMAAAAAGVKLDAENKWSKYFFDDETQDKHEDSQTYYKKLSELNDDKDYTIKIFCPDKSDPLFRPCANGEAWASADAFGNKHLTLCPNWFDGATNDKGDLQELQDSKVVQNNCKIGANGEKDWQHIQQYKAVKSFVLFHALTHFTYASETQPLDYAYNLWDCKKLRDGKHKNENFCKDEPEAMCKADKSFKNADTLAFVATGVYWEAQCEKEIDTEVGLSSTTENLDPFWNADEEDTNPSSDTDRGLTDEPDETLDSPEDAGGEPTPRGKRDAPTPEDEGGKPTRKGNGDKPAPSKEVSCETSDASPDTEDITAAINELRGKAMLNEEMLCVQENPAESQCTKMVDQDSAAISICGAVDRDQNGHTCKEILQWASIIQQTCLDREKGKAGGTYKIDEGQRVVVH